MIDIGNRSIPHTSRILGCCLTVLIAGCTSYPVGEQDRETEITSAIAEQSDLELYAEELTELAQDAGAWVTPILVYIAGYYNGDMVGLEFRYKSRESTVRKIEAKMQRDDLENPREVSIRDALRYTIRFEDHPSGNYDDAVAGVLELMENTGHQVLTVKNFWPRGDDYSGINTTLKAPNGLDWELQFHTPTSFDLKMSTHVIYEQMRQPGTSLELKRNLFEEASQQWNKVPIPTGVLEPQSIHGMEQIITRSVPEAN